MAKPKGQTKKNVDKTSKSESKKKYKVTIIKDRCKGCKLCVLFCPSGTLEMSQEINSKGYILPKVVDISKCKGCNLCFKYCPDFAIYCEEAKGTDNKKTRKMKK